MCQGRNFSHFQQELRERGENDLWGNIKTERKRKASLCLSHSFDLKSTGPSAKALCSNSPFFFFFGVPFSLDQRISTAKYHNTTYCHIRPKLTKMSHGKSCFMASIYDPNYISHLKYCLSKIKQKTRHKNTKERL